MGAVDRMKPQLQAQCPKVTPATLILSCGEMDGEMMQLEPRLENNPPNRTVHTPTMNRDGPSHGWRNNLTRPNGNLSKDDNPIKTTTAKSGARDFDLATQQKVWRD